MDSEIRKRKKSEESLRDTGNKLNMVLDAASMGDWELDLRTMTSQRRSLKHDQIFGYTEPLQSWTYDMFLSHVHPDDRTRAQQSFNDAIKDHHGTMECRIISADNEQRWSWSQVITVSDYSGNHMQMIGIVQDITERKNLEKKLEDIRLQLQSIIDSTTTVIFLKDLQGRFVFINSQCEMLFHQTRESVVGKTYYDIFPKDIAGCLTANDMEVETRKESLQFEETAQFEDGLHTYVSVKFPMFDITGNMYGICGIATDITQRIIMEEELKQLNTKLESKVVEETQKRRQNEQILIQQSKMAAMGEMVGLIAHQWRQPLNAIALIVQDIKDAYAFGELNAEYIKRSVDVTMGQADFMAKTIDDFRDFFKPSKEKLKFNVKTAIDELLSLFEPLFKSNYAAVSMTAEQTTGLITLGYPNEFKQVILNILTNSRDAIVLKRQSDASLKGQIEITIDAVQDKIIISIRDNGGGIPEHQIERIFENYYTTKGKEGTGVGLYMSKTIIETNMGGSLTARNIDGGAEFLITLGVAGNQLTNPAL
ncbi:MAG: PAS domain S-box protein [Nitrospirae bacterium]|nr:PAS domain S-box protein [Nitrospirota bacterium]